MTRARVRNLILGSSISVAVASGCLFPVFADDVRPMVAAPYVADFTGVGLVHCYCVANTSGCQSNFFWRAAGSPAHDWWQEVHLVKGKKTDLAHACFRKRDVDKLGSGLCCPVDEKEGKPDEVMLRKFFGVSEVRQKAQ